MATIIPEKKEGNPWRRFLRPHFPDKYHGHVGFEGPPTILSDKKRFQEREEPQPKERDPNGFPEPAKNMPHHADYAGNVRPEKALAVAPMPGAQSVLDLPVGTINSGREGLLDNVSAFPATKFASNVVAPSEEKLGKEREVVDITMTLVADHPMSWPVTVGVFYPDLLVPSLNLQLPSYENMLREYDEPNTFDAYPYGGDDRMGSVFLKEPVVKLAVERAGGIDFDYSVKCGLSIAPTLLNVEITQDSPELNADFEIDTTKPFSLTSVTSNSALTIYVEAQDVEVFTGELNEKDLRNCKLGAKQLPATFVSRVTGSDPNEKYYSTQKEGEITKGFVELIEERRAEEVFKGADVVDPDKFGFLR